MIKRLGILCLILVPFSFIGAQTIRLDANKLVPKVQLYFSPQTGSFEEGSTFDVPILVNTRGSRINGLEVRLNYDRDKLEIIKPSSGQSIIGVWVEPPGYDNTKGTASYVGVIPEGVVTDSGLVGTITFKAKKIGKAQVLFSSNTKVLLNDGLGSEAQIDMARSEYIVLPKAPRGVSVYSETHPLQTNWYNNNNPIISWDREEDVTGYSYILDNEPATNPGNEINTTENSKAFEDLSDGIWYFHIKAIKNGVWGAPGHFLVRIDTAPPAEFRPEANFLVASVNLTDRALVSFFTTDNLSGIDHYEVGVIDKSQPETVSPAFVQSSSPFSVPMNSNHLTAIVRAVDGAGNVRDASIALVPPSLMFKFINDNLVYILLFIIVIGLIGFITHYLVGHHIIRYLRQVRSLMRREEMLERANVPGQADEDVNPSSEKFLT